MVRQPDADGIVSTMKTYENFIQESSLNRIRQKDQKGGMAILSAQRGDKSKKENAARSKQLDKDIRGAGLPGATKVSGRYKENPGTKDEKMVGKGHMLYHLERKGNASSRKLLPNWVRSTTKIVY